MREREDLSWDEWGLRVNRYLQHLELLFTPDRFVIGGGVSKRFDKFADQLDVRAEVVPAELRNQAGIVGAALVAAGLGARAGLTRIARVARRDRYGELEGKTFLITGANTGIGRATTEDLARRGGRVILACRSAEKTLPVIEAITAETGNDRLEHLPLDLADLDSVRTAAATLVERGEPIDVLIANAGVAGQRGETAQGWELAFGINHLGHFLFVTSLLDLLRAGAPARVVIVASQAHGDAKDLDEDKLRGRTRTDHGPQGVQPVEAGQRPLRPGAGPPGRPGRDRGLRPPPRAWWPPTSGAASPGPSARS